MSRRLLVLLILVLVAGCQDKERQAKVHTVQISERPVDVTIPTAIWHSVENDYAVFNKKKAEGAEEEGAEPDEKGKESGKEKEKPAKKEALSAAESAKRLQVNKQELDVVLKKRPPSKSFPFKVILTEKTSGVLGEKDYVLQFPPGGGLLDLNRFFFERPVGSFYFKIEWDTKELPYKMAKVYFDSRSKERTLKDGKVGSGCNHYYDLTDYFVNQMKDGGMFLNTSNLRHVSLLTGNYYFLIFKEGVIHMAKLEILDSRHRDLMCVPE